MNAFASDRNDDHTILVEFLDTTLLENDDIMLYTMLRLISNYIIVFTNAILEGSDVPPLVFLLVDRRWINSSDDGAKMMVMMLVMMMVLMMINAEHIMPGTYHQIAEAVAASLNSYCFQSIAGTVRITDK